MSEREVWIHPEAQRETREAMWWYARRGGQRLADDLESRVRMGLERQCNRTETLQPLRYVPIALNAQRLPIGRFPYSVVVVPKDDDYMRVLAVAHHRRRPGYWLPRLVK